MIGTAARKLLRGALASEKPPFPLLHPTGFSSVEARGESDIDVKGRRKSLAYDAVMKVTRAAWWLHQSTSPSEASITLPLLVIDGVLATLTYDANRLGAFGGGGLQPRRMVRRGPQGPAPLPPRAPGDGRFSHDQGAA